MAEVSKVIFQLEVEAQGVQAEMAKTASIIKGATKEITVQNNELQKLQDQEKGLLELRKKSNNPTTIVNLTKAIEKNKAEIDKVLASQKKVNIETKVYEKTLDGLDDKLKSAFNKQIISSFEKQLHEITEEQKELNKTISDKKPLSGIQALKKEYRDLVSAAIHAGENTDIGRNFLKQAGEVKDRIADIQQTTKNFGSDTAIFDGLIGATQGVAAGFEIAQGAAALFGDENEDVQKALLKVNAAMAIANGLQQIQALLQKESAFRIQATAAAQRVYNLVVGEGTKATKILNATLKIGVVGAAIFLIQKFSKEIGDLFDKVKNSQFGKFFSDQFRDVNKENQDALTKEIEGAKLLLEINENKYRRLIALNKANGKETEDIEQEKLEAQLKIINSVNGSILSATKGHLFNLTEEQKKAAAEFLEQTKDLQNQSQVITAEARQRRIEADKKLQREIEDLQIVLIKNDRARQVAEINIQAERRIDELVLTKASKEKIAEATILIEKERQKKIAELEDIFLKRIVTNAQKELKLREDIAQLETPSDEREALKAQRRKDELAQTIDDINTVTQATLNAAQMAVSIEQKKQDALFEIQSRRVEQAAKIAENGNAELLQLEQERLDEIQKKREAFVRAQQILQQVEIVGNSIVAVSKAAAQGGVAAPATIAATIAALIAGFALVKTITNPAGFQEGGYTGDGDPSQTSTNLGNRGYKYHKKEFIFNEKLTKENLPTFRKIHSGELDLNTAINKAMLFDQIPMPILNNLLLGASMRQAQVNFDTQKMEGLLARVEKAIKGKPEATFNFNENGYTKHLKDVIYKQERIKNKAS